MIFLLALLSLAAPVPGSAAKPPTGPASTAAPSAQSGRSATHKVAVMDVRLSNGIDPALGPYLTQVLASEVGARNGVPPLVSSDIRTLLGFQATKRGLGCDEEAESCAAELAGALGVDEVVQATATLSGNQILVSAVRMDAHHAQPLARFAQSVPRGTANQSGSSASRDGDPLALSMRAAADTLFADVAGTSGLSRRGWALIAGGGAVVLAGVAVGVGVSALGAAHATPPDASSAHTQAAVADVLYAVAAVSAGTALWLWLGGSADPAAAHAAIAPAQHGGTLVVARNF